MGLLSNFDSWLEKQPLFPILDNLGKLSILIAVVSTAISYQSDRENAIKTKQFQAWQVINTAAGQTGSGGRELAMIDLIKDHVSMDGVNIENAWLQYADLSNGDFSSANFSNTRISGVEFRKANFSFANFKQSVLFDIDFSSAVLEGADFDKAQMFRVNLAGTDLKNAIFIDVKGLSCDQIMQAKNWKEAELGEGLVCQ